MAGTEITGSLPLSKMVEIARKLSVVGTDDALTPSGIGSTLTKLSDLSNSELSSLEIKNSIELGASLIGKDLPTKTEVSSIIDTNESIAVVSNTYITIPTTWEIGGLTSAGSLSVATDRIRTNFIDISTFNIIELINKKAMYRICEYDVNYTHIRQIQVNTFTYVKPSSTVRYIKILVLGTDKLTYDILSLTYVNNIINVSRKYASDFGFHPQNNATDNSIALNLALSKGGTVEIHIPGVYEFDSTIFIGDDTNLIFHGGVYLKRMSSSGYGIVNTGAFTRTWNKNITITGLNFICNGFQSNSGTLITGLRGQISFFYVKNLIINKFTCYDLLSYSFGIHICTFDNLTIDTHIIEGLKDAIHLGRGSKFIIKNGIYKTYDDPIALNGHDYATSNPEMGWISDGVVENCYDLNDTTTTGYFCRILAGSWVDWFAGMKIQCSDIVVNNGRMYRSTNLADGTMYISNTAPTHTTGTVAIDGIEWVMSQEDVEYSAGVKNVHFRDIFLKKVRPNAFSIHFDYDNFSRSYYPNSIAPIQEDLIFENIFCDGVSPTLISVVTPINNIKVINSKINQTQILLKELSIPGLVYPVTNILFLGCTFTGSGTTPLVTATANRLAKFKAVGSIKTNDSYVPTFSNTVTILANDI